MANLKVVQDGSNCNIICKIGFDDEIVKEDLLAFERNYIPGLTKPRLAGFRKLSYEVANCISLKKFLSTMFDKGSFFNILEQLSQIIEGVTKAGLNPKGVVDDLEYIFINNTTGEVFLIYLPLRNKDGNLKKLVSDMVYEISLPIGIDRSFLSSLMSQLNCDDVSFSENIKRYLKKQDSNKYDVSILERVELKTDERCEYDDDVALYEEDLIDEEDNSSFVEGTILLEEEGDGTLLLDDLGTILLEDDKKAKLIREATGEEFYVETDLFKIGKDVNSVDLAVNNPAVSRVHAVIIKDNDSYYIRDNKSTNKTYLNGENVPFGTDVELASEDKILLGNEVFYFVIE